VTLTIRRQGVLVLLSVLAPLSLWVTGTPAAGIDPRSLLVFIAVFFGSLVVGATGFGSAAVAGAIMLFWLVPVSAVPILIAASFTTQLISLGQLWHILRWRGCLPLLLGGLIGIPLGVLLLQRADADAFRVVFGIFLVCWSGYVLLRPQLRFYKKNSTADFFVGITGGITGGAIAFPGAIPAIWCTLTRNSKEEQRGTIQAFIFIMQLCTLGYLAANSMIGRTFVPDYLKMLPAIMLGTFVGVHLFTKINEASFRRLILLLLLIAGAAHIIDAAINHLGKSLPGA
jgi:uncharacterized protein